MYKEQKDGEKGAVCYCMCYIHWERQGKLIFNGMCAIHHGILWLRSMWTVQVSPTETSWRVNHTWFILFEDILYQCHPAHCQWQPMTATRDGIQPPAYENSLMHAIPVDTSFSFIHSFLWESAFIISCYMGSRMLPHFLLNLQPPIATRLSFFPVHLHTPFSCYFEVDCPNMSGIYWKVLFSKLNVSSCLSGQWIWSWW